MQAHTYTSVVDPKLSALFNAMFHSVPPKNFISSPLSVYLALAMVAEGASTEALKELQAAMAFGNKPAIINDKVSQAVFNLTKADPEAVVIKFSNSIYIANGFAVKDAYKKTLVSQYKAEAANVDFASPGTVKLVNDKISAATNGLIKDAVDQFTPTTQCVLVNTVYFKGKWATPFEKEETADADFTRIDGSKTKCKMMHKGGLYVGYLEGQNRKLISISYKDAGYKFVIELPTDRQLNGSSSELVIEVANSQQSKVNVFIPKFKATAKLELAPILKNLGIKGIFAGGLEGISSSPLAVSSVIHQACVSVDEFGTEAAAVTIMRMLGCAMSREPPKEFRADSPFYFHIVDAERQITLFSGAVTDPQQSN